MRGLPSENIALLAAAEGDTAWVHVGDYRRLMAIVAVNGAASADLNVKIEQASDASGTGAADVADKAVTTVLQADAADAQVIINVHRDNDLVDEKPFVRITASEGSALLLGCEPRHAPVSHAASVEQVVN